MAYLHCHNCGWSQDDFWSEHYNPLSEVFLRELREDLFKPAITLCPGDDCGKETMTGREFVARELERMVKQIRGMVWPTVEDWGRAKDTAVCPRCGKRDWDID